MNSTAKDILLKTISRTPEWLRHDLAAKEPAARLRAEEALAAIVADVLAKDRRRPD